MEAAVAGTFVTADSVARPVHTGIILNLGQRLDRLTPPSPAIFQSPARGVAGCSPTPQRPPANSSQECTGDEALLRRPFITAEVTLVIGKGFAYGQYEPGCGSLRQPTSQASRSETVAAKESPIPTPNSEETESLTVRYAELLRLRQEVRQAETRTVPHTSFDQRQTNRNH